MYSHRQIMRAATAALAVLILALSGATATLAQGQRHAPTSYLPQARQMYHAKRYAEAAKLYYLAIQNEGAGAGGFLYLAHCEYYCGNIPKALHYYRFITENFRSGAEAKTAAQFVARLTPLANKGSRMTGHTTVVSGGGAAVATSLLDRIEIVKPIVGHPEVSPATVEAIRCYITDLPPAVQQMLQNSRIKFCITPTLVDKLPALGYQEGRGYDGHTYKRCPGMCRGDTIYICERLVDEATNEVEAPLSPDSVANIFHHEVGHALDYCLGNFSATEDYRHCYLLDIARIPAEGAGSVSYFLQKSSAGQQECCAELAANVLGHGGHNAAAVNAYFPQTMLAFKKKLNL